METYQVGQPGLSLNIPVIARPGRPAGIFGKSPSTFVPSDVETVLGGKDCNVLWPSLTGSQGLANSTY